MSKYLVVLATRDCLNNPVRRIAVNDLKAPPFALVGVHIPFGNVEPPSAQAQRSVGNPLPDERVRCQMFELHQDIELCELIRWIEARIERSFLVEAEHGRSGMVQPFGKVGRVRHWLACHCRLHRAAFGMAAYDDAADV